MLWRVGVTNLFHATHHDRHIGGNLRTFATVSHQPSGKRLLFVGEPLVPNGPNAAQRINRPARRTVVIKSIAVL